MKSKDTISICYAVRDSVPIVNSENASDTMFINKTPFINYTKRARMYKRHRDSVWVNYQPDTLVMPKIKRDTLIEKWFFSNFGTFMYLSLRRPLSAKEKSMLFHP